MSKGKLKNVKLPKIVMTFEQLIGNGKLAELVMKLDSAEVDNVTACRLNKLIQALKPEIIEVEERYKKEIQEPYQERMLAFGVDVKKRPKTSDLTPEQLDAIKLENEALEELQKLPTDALKGMLDAPQHLKEIRISAAEIRALGPLFDESGEVRQEHFQKTATGQN